MSADDFDPFIERLYARTPVLQDAGLFAADVETRLTSASRIRTLALTAAGLVGGVVAVSGAVDLNLNLSSDAGASSAQLGQGFTASVAAAQVSAQGVADRIGLTQVDLGSMGGMQLFWITAGALLALLAAGAVRLSQEV
ncbi:MAG: hypothetical protein EON91_06290 [Brevundimonas sp.]|uniref:hypothetical protein n=1 Tax=Brevundimonas sp. TaxID=1871086 RepID=UPI0011FDD867|nr:hypothetical protein [Brevundimonas sp.]RZJ18163.1 MAG: hypothetical protein EON91_06290 [Brevundimonas sp.]